MPNTRCEAKLPKRAGFKCVYAMCECVDSRRCMPGISFSQKGLSECFFFGEMK